MSDPGPNLDAPVAVPRRAGRFGPWVSAGSVVVVVGVGAVTVAGRTLSAPPAVLAAAVLFLPYLYLSAAGLLFAAWTVGPDRRSAPVGLGVLSLSAAWLWIPGRDVADDDGARSAVRVMTWNVQRLWGAPDAAQCVAEVIRREAPDVVALLEVSEVDLAVLSGDLSCRHHTYTSAAGERRGGLAACSRVGGGWSRSRGEAARFVDDEDWYYVLGEFTRGDEAFNLLVAHLYPYGGAARTLLRRASKADPAALIPLAERGESVSRGQSDQAAALIERVSHLADPTVVAGDFNSTPDAALHVALRRRLTDGFGAAGSGFGGTVQVFGLPLRVDYVYATPELGVRSARVAPAGCSDHEPVVAELLVPPRSVSPARAGR